MVSRDVRTRYALRQNYNIESGSYHRKHELFYLDWLGFVNHRLDMEGIQPNTFGSDDRCPSINASLDRSLDRGVKPVKKLSGKDLYLLARLI